MIHIYILCCLVKMVYTILIQLSLLFKETLWLYSMGVKINLPESPLEQKGYLILLLTSWKQYEQLVIFFFRKTCWYIMLPLKLNFLHCLF